MIPYVWSVCIQYIYIYHHCFREGDVTYPRWKGLKFCTTLWMWGVRSWFDVKIFCKPSVKRLRVECYPLQYLTLVLCMLKMVQRGLNRSEQLKNKMFPPTTYNQARCLGFRGLLKCLKKKSKKTYKKRKNATWPLQESRCPPGRTEHLDVFLQHMYPLQILQDVTWPLFCKPYGRGDIYKYIYNIHIYDIYVQCIYI